MRLVCEGGKGRSRPLEGHGPLLRLSMCSWPQATDSRARPKPKPRSARVSGPGDSASAAGVRSSEPLEYFRCSRAAARHVQRRLHTPENPSYGSSAYRAARAAARVLCFEDIVNARGRTPAQAHSNPRSEKHCSPRIPHIYKTRNMRPHVYSLRVRIDTATRHRHGFVQEAQSHHI